MTEPTRETAIAAMFGMIESAEKISSTIAQFLVTSPDLDEMERFLFESAVAAIEGLCRTNKTSFEAALNAEDALNALLDKAKQMMGEIDE